MKNAPVFLPTLLSILGHGALVALMFLNLDFDDKSKTFKGSAAEIKPEALLVETVSVDSKKVENLVKKIRKKKKKETDKQKALEKKLAQLERNRKKEVNRSKKAEEKRKKEEKLAKEAEEDRKDKENQADLAQQKLAEEQERVEEARKKREQEELQKLRQEELERQMLEEENALGEEHRQFILTEKEKYVALIRDKIYANLVSGVDAKVKIKLAPGGLVLDTTCIEGDSIACKAAIIAIQKSEPLPVSKDPDVFAQLRSFNLKINKEVPGGL